MRKTIILGSLFSIFLMIMAPTLHAAESRQVHIPQTSPHLQDSLDTIVQAIQENYENDPHPQTFLLLKLMIRFLKFIASLPLLVVYIYLILLLLL